MPSYHNINGNRVQFTEAEETARDAEEAAWADGALARALANMRSRRNQLLAKTDFCIQKIEKQFMSISSICSANVDSKYTSEFFPHCSFLG